MSTLQDGVIVIPTTLRAPILSGGQGIYKVTEGILNAVSVIFNKDGKDRLDEFTNIAPEGYPTNCSYEEFEAWAKGQGVRAVLDLPFGLTYDAYSDRLFIHLIRLASGDVPSDFEVLLRQDLDTQVVYLSKLKINDPYRAAIQAVTDNPVVAFLQRKRLSRWTVLRCLAYLRGAAVLEEIANPVVLFDIYNTFKAENQDVATPSVVGLNTNTITVDEETSSILFRVPARFHVHWFGDGADKVATQGLSHFLKSIGVNWNVKKG